MEVAFSEELKQRQRYWLEHLRAASVQGVTLAEYGRVAQVDSDALYRWRALFKRKGVPIGGDCPAVPVSFATLRVSGAQSDGGAGVTVHVGGVLQVRCSDWPDPKWLVELSQCLQGRG